MTETGFERGQKLIDFRELVTYWLVDLAGCEPTPIALERQGIEELAHA